MTFYRSFPAAVVRVDFLKRLGIWPGIIGPDRRGLFRLTYDPPDASAR